VVLVGRDADCGGLASLNACAVLVLEPFGTIEDG
jgi:hypothetical protein